MKLSKNTKNILCYILMLLLVGALILTIVTIGKKHIDNEESVVVETKVESSTIKPETEEIIEPKKEDTELKVIEDKKVPEPLPHKTKEPKPIENIEPEKEPEPISEPVNSNSLGVFTLTAYCPCSKCCGKWANGITSTGVTATAGRTIAVDPKKIPYGTEVVINGHTYVAEDCGGAIKKNKIDIYFNSHEEALAFGRQRAEVFVKG